MRLVLPASPLQTGVAAGWMTAPVHLWWLRQWQSPRFLALHGLAVAAAEMADHSAASRLTAGRVTAGLSRAGYVTAGLVTALGQAVLGEDPVGTWAEKSSTVSSRICLGSTSPLLRRSTAEKGALCGVVRTLHKSARPQMHLHEVR